LISDIGTEESMKIHGIPFSRSPSNKTSTKFSIEAV